MKEKSIGINIEFTLTQQEGVDTLESINRAIRVAFIEGVQNRREYFYNGRNGMEETLSMLDHFMDVLVQKCESQIKLIEGSNPQSNE
tara:strand:- start:1158 stop:1418 length:261 start_codon:yes stop_codon:yes gene_type:complete